MPGPEDDFSLEVHLQDWELTCTGSTTSQVTASVASTMRRVGLSSAGEVPFVLSLRGMPFPGREHVWIDDESEVAVGVGMLPENALVTFWLDVSWPTQGQPARYLRQPRPISRRENELEDSLRDAMCLARRRRDKALRRCRYCKDRCLPGQMSYGDGACQGCAERYLGVLH